MERKTPTILMTKETISLNVYDKFLDIYHITGTGYNPKEMTHDEYVMQCLEQAILEVHPPKT